jgi:hypothetical protein
LQREHSARKHYEGQRGAEDQRGLSAPLCYTSAYVSIRGHTSAYVSIRQHTSAYVSIP